MRKQYYLAPHPRELKLRNHAQDDSALVIADQTMPGMSGYGEKDAADSSRYTNYPVYGL